MKKKICVITGSRAEYGLLKPLMDELRHDPAFIFQLAVTGMHLSKEFGRTYKEIEKDGLTIDAKVDCGLKSDTPEGISRSIAAGIQGFSKAYQKLKPDMVVVLGDRFEIFAGVVPALIAQIPVVHIHGGELSEGVFDDSLRHAITKMSHWHFTSTESYRERVIQLGEDPERVFNVGALGMDNIRNLKLLTKQELEKKLNIKWASKNLIVTFHPVTLERNTAGAQCKELLAALDELKDTHIIFTQTNADTYGRVINTMINDYVKKNAGRSFVFTSLGQVNYLSCLQYVDAVVGNSSSGIIEAPSFKIGTINIGDRQKGRIKTETIIDCEPTKAEILKAFKKLYSGEFQELKKGIVNPYGDGKTAFRIKNIFKTIQPISSLKKKFHDIPQVAELLTK